MGVQESTYGLRRWTFSSMHGPALPLGCPRMALLPAALSVFKSRTEVLCRRRRCTTEGLQAACRAAIRDIVQDLTTPGGLRRWRRNKAMALSKTLFLG